MRRLFSWLTAGTVVLLSVGAATTLAAPRHHRAKPRLHLIRLHAASRAKVAARMSDMNGNDGDVTCSGVAPTTVPHDLIVPSGGFCLALTGTTVGHDVLVEQGATLGTGAITVRHDVIGLRPDAIEIGDPLFGPGRSSIGHDVFVVKASSTTTTEVVCAADIGHDLAWIEGTATTGTYIGDLDVCSQGSGAVSVGHDGTFLWNSGSTLDISDNNPANSGGFGHDLGVFHNGSTVVESNAIGHDCHQGDNHPYTNNDGDSTGPNTAGHDVDACNTPNP